MVPKQNEKIKKRKN